MSDRTLPAGKLDVIVYSTDPALIADVTGIKLWRFRI